MARYVSDDDAKGGLSDLISAPLLSVFENIASGAKIVLNASRDLIPVNPIAEGEMGPISVVSVPIGPFDNLISGSGMTMALAFGPAMISFPIPYIFDHHLTVKVFGILRIIYAAFQGRSSEEAFSFRVC